LAKRGSFLFAFGEMGAHNFFRPVMNHLENHGWRTSCYVSPKLASSLPQYPTLTPELAANLISDSSTFSAFFMGGSRYSNLEKHMVLAARRHKVPSFSCLDTWSDFEHRFSDVENNEIRNCYAYLPDNIFAIDELAVERAKLAGIDEKILKVTGSPYLEEFLTQLNKADRTVIKKNFCNNNGIDPNSTLILFVSEEYSKHFREVSNPGPKYSETDILDDACNAVESVFKNFHLLVKLHPFQTLETFTCPPSLKKIPHSLIKNVSPVDALTIVDLVLGMRSMLLIQGGVAGLPVVSYQKGKQNSDEFIGNIRGWSKAAYTEQELVEILRNFRVQIEKKLTFAPIVSSSVINGAIAKIVEIIEEFV